MTVNFPDDEDDGQNGDGGGGLEGQGAKRGKKGQTYGRGARVDVEAGRVHEVWMGSSGCEYVIGE